MPTLPPLQRLIRRVLPALLLATLAGGLAARLAVPLPWMIGPLFAIAILRMAGARPAAGRSASGRSAPRSASISPRPYSPN